MTDGNNIVHNPPPRPRVQRSWFAELGGALSAGFLVAVVMGEVPHKAEPVAAISATNPAYAKVSDLCGKLGALRDNTVDTRAARSMLVSELRTIVDGMNDPPECAKPYILRE